MKLALDTNLLVYAEGVNADERHAATLDLIDRLPAEDVVLPVQVLGELYNVLTRRAGFPREAARSALLAWRDTFELADTSREVMLMAADLAAQHEVRIWDAVILCTASVAGCRLLLSEDFHEGFTWHGVTVTNPFRESRHALLESILGSGANGTAM